MDLALLCIRQLEKLPAHVEHAVQNIVADAVADDVHEANLFSDGYHLPGEVRALGRIVRAADVDDRNVLEGRELALRWLAWHL